MNDILRWWNLLEENWKIAISDALGYNYVDMATSLDIGLLKKVKSISSELIDKVESLKPLKYFENLEGIYFDSCKGFTEIYGIENLKKLKYLCISDTNVKSLNGIEGLANLELLMIDYTEIEDLSNLSTLEKLEHITLIGCDKIKEILYLKTLPNLRQISVNSDSVFIRYISASIRGESALSLKDTI